MANDKEFKISDLSYTNKDFQTIFPELLELVKKLECKWDPTITNESDPGVVLLKLMAIIADKNNYNIDKNVLECFPLSVTQEKNAYQLFEQLGYRMKWYRAAGSKSKWVKNEGEDGKIEFVDYVITLTWIAESMTSNDNPITYTIPQFTMVCDEDTDIVYTILKESQINSTQRESISVPALQGVYVDYTINNNYRIRYTNLDSKRRLYFNDYNVAENGIFIASYDETDWLSWKKVDNLETQPIGDKCYKFGLSQELDRCYIEFPENASELFGDGLKIRYIKTKGIEGNISPRTISQGYNVSTLKPIVISGDEEEVSFNEVIGATNASSISNGQNPESIDEAYKNYTRIVGTFDTLVTLRDYVNAILNTNEVSNGFVTDRTNDPQDSYKVMTKRNDLNIQDTYVELDGNDKPLMTAFDLKFYLLRDVNGINSKNAYNSTFDMLYDQIEINDIEALIESQKCIQHDYKYIASDGNQGKICFFKNYYPIVCKVIPQYSVTNNESEDIIAKIKEAVLKEFNSKKVEFGEEVSYERLYNTILKADGRIKSIFLNEIEYETYALVLDRAGTNYEWVAYKVSVSSDDFDNGVGLSDDTMTTKLQKEVYAKSVLAGVTQLYEKDTNFTYTIDQNGSGIIKNVAKITTIPDGNCTSSNNEHTYEIQANETLQVYAPNYLQDKVYGSYVRYYYHSSNNLQQNEIHELGSNDYIWFAWKENDTDLLYKTKKYVASEIIQANFILPHDVGTTPSTTPSTSAIATWNSLSSTESCAICKKSEQKIENHECYWITNEISRDTNGNPSSYDITFDANGERLLKENEYFFYTNTNRTELFIFGSGTLLKRGNTQSTIQCNYNVDIAQEIQENGVLALDNLWVKVDELTITEMEIISAGEDETVTFTKSGVTTLRLGNAPIKVDSGTSVFVGEEELNSRFDGWNIILNLALNTTGGVSQKLIEDQSIELYDNSGSTIVTITNQSISTSLPLNVVGGKDINVSYVEDGETKYLSFYPYSTITLPTIEEEDEDGNIVIKLPANTQTTTITFSDTQVPKGNYVLEIRQPNASVEEITISNNGSPISQFNTQVNKLNGYLYYKIDDSVISDLLISIKRVTYDEDEYVTIYPLYRYKMNNFASNNNIEAKLIELDTLNEYDYTYIVDNDVKIENPLLAESFFDVNHIFNKFTIAQIAKDYPKINVTNISKR